MAPGKPNVSALTSFVKARRAAGAGTRAEGGAAQTAAAAAANAALPSKSKRLLAHDLSVLEVLAAELIARNNKRRKALVQPRMSDFVESLGAFSVCIKEQILLTSVYNERLAEISSVLWQTVASLFHEAISHGHALAERERDAHRATTAELHKQRSEASYKTTEAERAGASAAEMRFRVDRSEREYNLLKRRAAEAEKENRRLRGLLEEHISNAQRVSDRRQPTAPMAPVELSPAQALAEIARLGSRQPPRLAGESSFSTLEPERYVGSVEFARLATLVADVDCLIESAEESAEGTSATLDNLRLLVRTVGRIVPKPAQMLDEQTQCEAAEVLAATTDLPGLRRGRRSTESDLESASGGIHPSRLRETIADSREREDSGERGSGGEAGSRSVRTPVLGKLSLPTSMRTKRLSLLGQAAAEQAAAAAGRILVGERSLLEPIGAPSGRPPPMEQREAHLLVGELLRTAARAHALGAQVGGAAQAQNAAETAAMLLGSLHGPGTPGMNDSVHALAMVLNESHGLSSRLRLFATLAGLAPQDDEPPLAAQALTLRFYWWSVEAAFSHDGGAEGEWKPRPLEGEDGVFPLRPAFGYEETNDLSRTFVAESAALAGAARACEGLPRVVAEWCAAAVRALARERFSGRVVELDAATLAVLAVLAERGALAGRAEGAGGAAAAQPPPLLEQVALQLNRWRNAATDAVLLSLAERTWEQREKRVSDLLNSFGRDGELRDAPQLALTVSDLRREDAEMRGALAERGAGGDGAAKPWRGLRLVEGAFQRVLAQRTDAAARLPTRSSAQREVA